MSRKLAREAAFKALFQLDFNFEDDRREDSENLAIETMFDDNPKLTKKDLAFIESTVKGTRAHLEDSDEPETGLAVVEKHGGGQKYFAACHLRNEICRTNNLEEHHHQRGGRIGEKIRYRRFKPIR